MPLRHERPSVEYMRELRAVARSAAALRDHLPKVNLLPDGFPLEQVEGFCNALVRLPDGTAEGSIAPLRAADSELNRIRQRFIPAHDEDAGDEEPLVPRNSDFDLRLVGLMAAVRGAIERYKVESGEELNTDVTPDRPVNPEVETAKPAAFDDIATAANDIIQAEAALDAANPSVRAELDTEKRLIVSADVNLGSAGATLATEAPQPTVLGWLSDNLNSVADEMDRIIETAGPKVTGVGKEIGGLAGDFTEIWFPKITKSLQAVGRRLSSIREKLIGESETAFTLLPRDFDMVEVYNRLFRNEPVPDRWAPFVTEIEAAFDDPEYIGRAVAKRITEDPDNFFKTELLASLVNLKYLDMPGRNTTSTEYLNNLTNLETLYLSGRALVKLHPIDKLISLHTLHMWTTGITDISELKHLKSLKILSLNETPLINIGPLAAIRSLQQLDLSDTGVTDLSPLAGLTNLQSLGIDHTQVINIKPLQSLTRLETLNLAKTRVSDATPLAKLIGLRHLYLRDTQIADLAPLASLTNLEFLDLRNMPVIDLTPLVKLTNLKSLHLEDTLVADTSPLTHLVEAGLKIHGG